MKHKWTVFLLLLISLHAPGQVNEIRRLRQHLPWIKDSLLYTDAVNRLALLYYEKDPDSTLYFTQLARSLSERHQYTKGRADAFNNLGVVSYLKGNNQLALRYYDEALGIYKSLNDTSNTVQLLMNIGLVFLSRNELHRTARYFDSARNCGQYLQHDSIMSLLYLNTLTIFPDSLKDADKLQLLNKARAIATRYKDERVLVQCTVEEGMYYLGNNETGRGINLLKEAMRETEKLQTFYVSMDIYILLGDLLLEKKDTAGLGYYRQALELAHQNNYHEYEKTLSGRLYDYYETAGDLVNTRRYSQQLVKAYKTEDSLNAVSGINYIDYAIKDKEAESFKEISKARRNTIQLFIILFVIALLLLFFIIRSFIIKRKLARALMQLNIKVTRDNEVLQTNNEFNNRIFSILAHDFKEPLVNMKYTAALLKRHRSLNEEDFESIIESIEHTSTHSLEIFGNVLEWIRRQLSGYSYTPANLDLKTLVDTSILTYTPLIKQHAITAQNEVIEGTIIQAEKEMIQFIHRNLVHNAVKFSPDSSVITIQAVAEEKEIIVSVKNEGAGIPEDKLHTLFNYKDQQVYANAKERGAGVALMICRDFIEKMNGRIWATSEAQQGTVFYYALPVIE